MSARDDRAEAMREACAEAVREIIDSIDDKGLFNKTEAACIRSTLRRAVSRIEALPLPATPADDAVGEARDRFTEAALHAIGCRAAYGPNHPAAMNPSAKVREAWAALLAAERAQGEKGGDRG